MSFQKYGESQFIVMMNESNMTGKPATYQQYYPFAGQLHLINNYTGGFHPWVLSSPASLPFYNVAQYNPLTVQV
jgi:hypothetical protein